MARYHYEDSSDGFPWWVLGIAVALIFFIVLIASALTPSSNPHHNLADKQYSLAVLSAKEFAGNAGMTYISCWGKDTDNDGSIECNLRTIHGTYQELLCTFDQQGCIPWK